MHSAATELADLPQFDLSEFVRRVLAEDLGIGRRCHVESDDRSPTPASPPR